MINSIGGKRVFALFLYFFFLSNYLFSSNLSVNSQTSFRDLVRVVTSQNILSTKHFNIYWSNEYPYISLWLTEVNGVPWFIDSLSNYCEEIYDSFIIRNLNMPPQVEIYILNSGLLADGLLTNGVSGIGTFTVDDFAEVSLDVKLGESRLTSSTLDLALKTTLSHEFMHIVQYENSIISGEESAPINMKWFTEGTAVASEFIYSGTIKDIEWYLETLMHSVNSGLFQEDLITSYSNGLLFIYLYKKYGYTLNNFINIYKKYSTPKDFFDYISYSNGVNSEELFFDFYNSLLYNKSLYDGLLDHIEIEPNIIDNELVLYGGATLKTIELEYKKGWNLISLPFDIDDFSIFGSDYFLIWNYINNKYNCFSNSEIKNSLCIENYGGINHIDRINGFWIYFENDKSILLNIFETKHIIKDF